MRGRLRVIGAVCTKDLRLALRERASTIIGVLIPLNFLVLFILFALSGGEAPIAVVMDDQEPLAQQLLVALQQAHSFQVHVVDGSEAERELREGSIVGVVTLPANFDQQLRSGQQVELQVEVNNLNVDFTNDIRRAVPLAITSFYAQAFPGQVVVQAREIDQQAGDTGYVPYLAVSIVVAGLFIEGLLQAGIMMAREYEDHTITELALAPAGGWTMAIGKIAAALVLTAAAGLVVTMVVVLPIGVHPVHPWEVIAFGLLLSLPAVALGLLLGVVLRRRQAVIPLALGSSLPLFFLSGPFGPPNWAGPAGTIALISPLTYAIALFQHAFHGYQTAQPSLATDVVVLLGFSVVAIGAAGLMLHRGAVG
ncbi:MAG: ABC transporter permease [Chloroflexi bacterium]|nr:ABC transporter permease [Chloroflexota bacterium]